MELAIVQSPYDLGRAEGDTWWMGLATITGTGWDGLRASIDGFRAVSESKAVLAGARDIDGAELELLERSDLRRADDCPLQREPVQAFAASGLTAGAR